MRGERSTICRPQADVSGNHVIAALHVHERAGLAATSFAQNNNNPPLHVARHLTHYTKPHYLIAHFPHAYNLQFVQPWELTLPRPHRHQ